MSGMHVLQIEHNVEDFATWKRDAFDADPLGRAAMGVRRHRVACLGADPNYVFIELEFDTRAEADATEAALRRLWRNPLARIGAPIARIAEMVEVKEY